MSTASNVGPALWQNPTKQYANVKGAWNQLSNYQTQIPELFVPNQVCVISDGLTARVGGIGGQLEHYGAWRTIDTEDPVSDDTPELEVVIRGLFDHRRLLDYIRDNIVFVDEKVGLVKKVAKYHQFWAVQKGVESTVEASRTHGRAGVIWHTQGSGKSLEMVMLVTRLSRDARMENPTIVMITDRNDLDDQLFAEVFAPTRTLPELPVRATDRKNLRELLTRPAGGIVFTTMQKFAPDIKGDAHPLLTDRRNVVVIADEAHRSQYDFLDGFARHLRDALPNASFLGFTGTPLELSGRSTREVFGDYVSVYDLTRAVEDGATVRIFYESRLAKVKISDEQRKELDDRVEEIVEGEEDAAKSKLQSKWARQEAIVGADERIRQVAKDIVDQWDKRSADLVGKGMIVTMSRRIAAQLYEEIVVLKPDWHHDDVKRGKIKVVYTGSSADPANIAKHVMSKQDQQTVKTRAKTVVDKSDPANKDVDDLELVIVRDMWLTGFDAPAMHTMYVDKPMQGAGLMQAIARVNRVFKDKPGGLVVDYIGIAHSLRAALAEYTKSDQDQAGVPTDQFVKVVKDQHDVLVGLLKGHTWDPDPKKPSADKIKGLKATVSYVLADADRQKRFKKNTKILLQAFALVGARDEVADLREDVTYFAAVYAALVKKLPGESGRSSDDELDTALGQLVSAAVASEGVVDVFADLGLDKPEMSILSAEFLKKLKRGEQTHLQLELLKRLLSGQVKVVSERNVVSGRKFSAMLEQAINRYTNKAITTAQAIQELVSMAEEMAAAAQRGNELGLSDDEVAFYDAITRNGSAVLELGDETLKAIAHELVEVVRKNATIDWTLKESIRAGLRAAVKRLLRRYRYPPDQQESAVDLVLEQAEALARAA